MILKLTAERAELEKKIADTRRGDTVASKNRLILVEKTLEHLRELETQTGEQIALDGKAAATALAVEASRLKAAEAAAAAREKELAKAKAFIDGIKGAHEQLSDAILRFRVKASKDYQAFGADVQKTALENKDTITSLIAKYADLGETAPKWLRGLMLALPVVDTHMRELAEPTEDYTEDIKELGKVAADVLPPMDEMSEITDEAFDQKRQLDAENFKLKVEEISDEISNAIGSLQSMIGSLEDMGVTGLENFSGLLTGLNSFADAAKSFASGNVLGGIAGAVGGGVSVFKSMFGTGGMFGSSSDEQLLASQGEKAGKIFGKAWSDEAASTMASVAKDLKTTSGQTDVLAAMFHPETMKKVLESVSDMGEDAQKEWAKKLEHNVKPVLMTTMGMSPSEAAQAMAPLFQEIQDKAGPGGIVDENMQRMIDWAGQMGVELGDGLTAAADQMRSMTEIGDDQNDSRLKQMRIEDQISAKIKGARRQFRGGENEKLAARAKLAAADKELSDNEDAYFRSLGRDKEKFAREIYQMTREQQGIDEAVNGVQQEKLLLLSQELQLVSQLQQGYANIAAFNGAEISAMQGNFGGRSGTVERFEKESIGAINLNVEMDGTALINKVINVAEQRTGANQSGTNSESLNPKGDSLR